MIELTITHYAVGQGLCVVVNCTYPGGKCLAILDMGTTYPIDSETDLSIEDINAEIKNNDNRVQCVLISHLDRDHCNLFEKLTELHDLEKVIVGGTAKDLKITDYSKDSLINGLFPFLKNRSDVNLCWYDENFVMTLRNPYFSILNEGNNPSYVLNLPGGIRFCINVLVYRADLYQTMTFLNKSYDYLINSGSTIALITLLTSYGAPKYSYLFTGDATNMTLNCLNEQKFKFESEYKAILIPHHGSQKNIYDTGENQKILDAFLERYHPNVACVSAKCLAVTQGRNGWVHPHHEIIQKYKNLTDDDIWHLHMVTSFSYDKSLNVHYDTCSKNVYQTYWIDEGKYPDFSARNVQLSFRMHDAKHCEKDIYIDEH